MTTPADKEREAVDLANYRKFRRLRAENPFHAAELLLEVGAAALERGRELEPPDDSEPPKPAA